MAKLLYQGHGSLRIVSQRGEVLYLDPFIGEGYHLAADYILITHEHYDHNQIGMATQKDSTVIVRAKDMLIDGIYQKRAFGSFVVESVPAYNQNHSKEECVGYLIAVDGVLIYAAGDTSLIKEMYDLTSRKIDYAFFPTDGIYNMDAREASMCARIVSARFSIPIHSKPDSLYDETITQSFSCPHSLFLKPGHEILLQATKDE